MHLDANKLHSPQQRDHMEGLPGARPIISFRDQGRQNWAEPEFGPADAAEITRREEKRPRNLLQAVAAQAGFSWATGTASVR